MDNPVTAPTPGQALASLSSPGAVASVEPPVANADIGILDEFQTNLIKFWGELPNKAFFFSLLGAWLILFQFWGNPLQGVIHTPSLFSWMLESYNSDNKAAADDSIGNFVPIVVLGILWWKRNLLLSGPLKIWLPALLLVVGALGLHMIAFVVQQPHFSIVALFVGIYGLTGLTWGFKWLQRSFFPFFLFGFSVPLGNHSDFITVKLRLLVCQLVELVSHHLLGIGVIREGTALYDPSKTYVYEVAAACSGIRSLFIILLLAIVYGFITFPSMWQRIVMIALAFPLAVLGNLVRMMCIVVAATIGGKKWGDWAHEDSVVSLLPYIPVILGLFYVGGWLEKLSKPGKKVVA
jgi:exosortase